MTVTSCFNARNF